MTHEVLPWAIKSAISNLDTEIGHADNQAMRETLRKRRAIQSVIHARFGFSA